MFAVAPPTGSVDRNLDGLAKACVLYLSLPPRGAWIEMADAVITQMDRPRRSPHGERG